MGQAKAIRVGVSFGDWWYEFWGRPQEKRGLVDLSEGQARLEPLFFESDSKPKRAEKKNERAHQKWVQGSRVGIECPYCGEEVYTSQTTLTNYGKSCPRCGAKHQFYGITIDATPMQRAYAQRTFGRPKTQRAFGASTAQRGRR